MPFRQCRPNEQPFPLELGNVRLLERALEHELNIAEWNLHAIHSTRHERMNADRDRTQLRAMLDDLRGGI